MEEKIDKPHGCRSCYVINEGYIELDNEVKICKLCGGKVLFLQEAFDYIAELHTEKEYMKGDDYGY